MLYPKKSWISDTEYNPPDNSNFSLHVEADALNLLFLYDFLFVYMHNICV